MILQNLSAGAAVTLEIQWGDSSYEVPTKVEAVQSDSILITPFTYRGTVLDIGKNQFKDMIYNLYALDPATGSRFVWKNILLEMTTIRGEQFYEVRVNTFGRYGRVSDRRDNSRILLDTGGTVMIGKNGPQHVVQLHDISNEGISFVAQENIETAGKNILVDFEDRVHEHFFHLDLECVCVRQVQYEGKYLYGCRVVNSSKDTLVYACLKKMDIQASSKLNPDKIAEEQK